MAIWLDNNTGEFSSDGNFTSTTFDEVCEHGLSAWLCMGPNHYPSRQDEMEGRYF